MTRQYLRMTSQLRAEHVAALAALGRGVATAAVSPLEWRKFVVVTAASPR